MEMKKGRKLKDIILPNQRINFFVITVMLLGIVSGSIFLMMLSKGDKGAVILQIQNFFQNVSKGNIDSGLALRGSLIINYLFIFLIWGLGFSMIFVLVNIFLTYLKGFLVGFSVSSIFITFGYKGIVASILYVFFSQLLSLIVVYVLCIYSIMFSFQLLKVIFNKKGNHRLMLKKYFVILMMCVVGGFISSLLEVYLFPNMLRLVISLYL